MILRLQLLKTTAIRMIAKEGQRFQSKGPKWPPKDFEPPPPLKEYEHLNERQRKDQGYPCHYADEELMADAWKAKQLIRSFNSCDVDDDTGRSLVIKKLFHIDSGENIYIEPPFLVDYGYNIKAGDNLFVNFGCIFLDTAPIVIGKNVSIAPGVSLFCATHPLDPVARLEYQLAKPIKIGDDVWLGGSVVVCPGVDIGNGVVAAAGAVITKSVPPFCVVGGNPAKIIRYLPGATKPDI